ncbi:MAG: hypothetical protein AAFO81_03425 [Pseudomonadota bacterium]
MSEFRQHAWAHQGAALALIALSLAGRVAQANDVDAFAQCRDIASAAQRLACYDAKVDALTAAADTTTSSDSDSAPVAAPAPATTTDPEASFGAPAADVMKKQVEQIEAVIEKVTISGGTRAVIALDNGQVWRQVASSSLKISAGDRVTITRKSLGSFRLTKPGTTRPMRVKRVQ